MKNKDYLTVRQEELMNFLWKVNEPLMLPTAWTWRHNPP